MDKNLAEVCGKIFENAPLLKVPPYQREYTWTSEELDEFLSDLEKVEVDNKKMDVNSPHFMGLLVFVKQKDDQGALLIVDGQQRLTTITLMAVAMHDSISEYILNTELSESDKDGLEGIKKYYETFIYYERRPLRGRKPKLISNRKDSEMFEIIVDLVRKPEERTENLKRKFGKSYSRKKLFAAYQLFRDAFKEQLSTASDTVKAMELFFAKVYYGLSFVVFKTEDESDAFDLFETLNDRGMELSAIDLVKNKLLQQLEGKEGVVESWESIFGKGGLLPEKEYTTFVRAFLMLRFKYVSNNDIFRRAKELLDNSQKANRFILSLREEADYYGELISPKNDLPIRIMETLYLLTKSRVKQWRVLGLFALKAFRQNKLTGPELDGLLDVLLKICVRFKILNKRFNAVDHLFPELAFELNDGLENGGFNQVFRKVMEKLFNLMKKNASDKDLENFMAGGFTCEDNDLSTIILIRMISPSLPDITKIDYQAVSLEHVLPTDYQQFWGEIQEGDQLRISIGNMLLISGRKNSAIKNRKYSDKRSYYEAANCQDFFELHDRKLSWKSCSNNEDWLKIIKKREKILAEQFRNYF